MQNFRNFDALLPLYFFTMEGYSLMDLKEILEQYKEKLVIGENTYAQVLEELRNFINLEQIPQSNVHNLISITSGKTVCTVQLNRE